METTVAVALIVALSTLGGALLTNWWANKRFKQELERAREQDSKQRRREIRGEPLLKLRSELALMATKLDSIVSLLQPRVLTAGEKNKQEETLKRNLSDFNDYVSSGDFQKTLFMQWDSEIINKVQAIEKDYLISYFILADHNYSNAEEMKQAIRVSEINKNRIIEVQEIINKRLEEL
jgi:hypothetical protein